MHARRNFFHFIVKSDWLGETLICDGHFACAQRCRVELKNIDLITCGAVETVALAVQALRDDNFMHHQR